MASRLRRWRFRERLPVDMNQRMWLGWRRWTWVRLSFVLLTAGQAFGLYLVVENNDHDRRRAETDAVQRGYEDCLQGQDVNAVIRSVIELTPQGTNLQLTVVPGFEELDPATQAYLRNLETVSRSDPDDPSFRDLALELLPTRDCMEEYPTAKQGE